MAEVSREGGRAVHERKPRARGRGERAHILQRTLVVRSGRLNRRVVKVQSPKKNYRPVEHAGGEVLNAGSGVRFLRRRTGRAAQAAATRLSRGWFSEAILLLPPASPVRTGRFALRNGGFTGGTEIWESWQRRPSEWTTLGHGAQGPKLTAPRPRNGALRGGRRPAEVPTWENDLL